MNSLNAIPDLDRSEHVPKPISEELLDAYSGTEFVVLSEPELPLRVGIHSPDADKLLSGHGAASAAIVTAWNPFSQTLPHDENVARQQFLTRAVEQAGPAWLPAEGRDREGKWPSEQSLMVFDASAALLDDWMLRFGQNAVLVLSRGQAPAFALHPELRIG